MSGDIKQHRKYWLRRAISNAHAWENRCQETVERELAAHYQRALREIKGDILKLYAGFAKDNGMDLGEAQQLLSGKEFREWRMSMQEYLQKIANGDKGLERELNTLAMRPRITRLEKLYAETLQELNKLGRDVDKSMKDFLAEAYKSTYAKNIFDFVKVGGLSVAVSKLDSTGVEKVLSARWSGKNFIQRIWTNIRLLGGVLKETVANGVHRGLSIQQMSRMVENKMQSGYSNAVRLVRTEMNFVNNQANFDSMKDAGITAYEFIATLDNRTSTQCKTRDGETYLLEEKSVGFNYPPLHPRCRSTVAPFIEGVSRKGTRIAKDKSGKYIDIPSAMSYKDYEAVYIKKEKSFETWNSQFHVKEAASSRKIKTDFATNTKVVVDQNINAPSQMIREIPVKPRSEYRRFISSNEANDSFGSELTRVKPFNKWQNKVTDFQEQVVRYYTGNAFLDMNGILRGIGIITKENFRGTAEMFKKLQSEIKRCAAAIAKFELTEDIIVHRTVGGNMLSKFKEALATGEPFIDEGFMSTTPIKGSFNGGSVNIEIAVPKGKGIGAWVDPISKFRGENEFLMQRGTKLKIIDVQEENGEVLMIAEWTN